MQTVTAVVLGLVVLGLVALVARAVSHTRRSAELRDVALSRLHDDP